MQLNTIRRELYPSVMVDIAIFSVDESGLRVLLVHRANEPQKGLWALPGGFLKPDVDATLEAAARRVLIEKIGVDTPHLEEVCTFSGKDRDPRGWSISVLFFALLPRDQVQAVVKAKVDAVEWVDARNHGLAMAFDHSDHLNRAIDVLKRKVARHALPLHLMPTNFTMTALQRACEAILGLSLDKSVFRRRLKADIEKQPPEIPDLVEVAGATETGHQRPAQLYKAREGFVFLE
ncbi:MAG: NUDIX hydrolase [Rhodoferax sp.]|nr:NUDIX hydrolase [Rhodoferax sp.]